MSVKALSAVFEESIADGAAFTVLICMADWADHLGFCYPSYTQIMRKARLRSRATVLAAIDKLITLGEIERVSHGHAASKSDDDIPSTVARQRRNQYRILLVKPKAQVVQQLNYLSRPQVDQRLIHQTGREVDQQLNHLENEVDQSINGGSSTIDPEVDQSAFLHREGIRPSVQTVSRPSATAAAAVSTSNDAGDEKSAAAAEEFRLAWNDCTVDPMPTVDELTPGRRILIAAALDTHPLEAWEVIFRRVAASAFLRGRGERGFVASLWWLLAKPEHAIAVMEGQYDDGPRRAIR